MFEFTVSLGNLLEITSILGGGFAFLYRMESRLSILSYNQVAFKEKIDKIEEELAKLSEVTVQMARQDERMTAQDMRIQTITNRIDEYVKSVQRPLIVTRTNRAKRLESKG